MRERLLRVLAEVARDIALSGGECRAEPAAEIDTLECDAHRCLCRAVEREAERVCVEVGHAAEDVAHLPRRAPIFLAGMHVAADMREAPEVLLS